MNYPLNELAVLTPIIFFVLLFAFPIIGIFGGWRRAAYWGGGNFINYIIGLVVWKLAGGAIANAIVPVIKNLLPDAAKSADFTQLVNSIVVPAYFLILILISNILLVICYYTFAKRLLRIGKYKNPEAKKTTGTKAKQVKVNANTSLGDKRWFNMVVGGVGMTALMLPITLSFTHCVAITTTSVDTRKNNKLTSDLYNGLQGLSGGMSWFSYYNGTKVGEDYAFLFSSLGITNKSKEIGGKVYNGFDIVTVALPETVKDLSNEINELGTITAENFDEAAESLSTFTTNINDIISGVGAENLGAIVDSDGAKDLVNSLIGGTSVPIGNNIIEHLEDEGSAINAYRDAINNPDANGNYQLNIEGIGSATIPGVTESIPVKQSSFDALVNTTYEMFDFGGETITPENEQELKSLTSDLLKMFFVVR